MTKSKGSVQQPSTTSSALHAEEHTMQHGVSSGQQQQEQPRIGIAIGGDIPGPSLWVIDSTATHHVTNNRASLLNFQPLSPPTSINCLGAGGSMPAIGIGQALVTVKTSDRSSCSLLLDNTLYAPNAVVNVVALPRAIKAGVSVMFTSEGCVLHKGDVSVVGIRSCGLFCFEDLGPDAEQ